MLKFSPSQDWFTLVVLPVNVRTVLLPLSLIVSVQVPGLASVMVEGERSCIECAGTVVR